MRVRRSWLWPVSAASLVLLVAGGGALASVETGTVGSFGRGLWWAVALMTTVGFIGAPPSTVSGELVSAVLMLTGFMLLALVSAAMASLFVRDDSAPFEARERSADAEILDRLADLQDRMVEMEQRLGHPDGDHVALRRPTDSAAPSVKPSATR